ncbi:Tat (twin-arginine translocation) pathway signal sequence [Cyclobacterium xiamenense]|uniref:Tat (Twin-arginine translocation) pathway signal sequence n=1 Tax=Cyclobacterium xiamenense TaxID=1297121 RepID=A0A1H6VM94_9BACT|nr:sugar phosphate isomerase/epimerase family protein [Cyclobacterium xiamenense]SEJ05768.1 Tat (twin-arginine translocation) pathway signal sequence [Cyclobacterium xiamenense]
MKQVDLQDSTHDRRNFLKKAGLGVAGLASFQAASLANSRHSTSQSKKVELAIATITCDGFGDENFEKAFQVIPQLPFKNVEFNCWYGRNLTPSGIGSIQQRCYEHGLTPICVQGSSFGAEGNIVKDVAHKLWLMEAAKKLGCRRVKCTGAGRGKAGGPEAVVEIVRELAPAAEEMDVLLLLENHANNNIEFMEDYEKIFDAINSTHVGMCMDNAHFNGSNVGLMEVVDKFHEKILHIDIKDTEKMGVHKVVNFGEGVTDNDGVIQKMLDHGYEGYLLVEMAPPLNETTLVKDLTRAYQLFEKYQS